MLIGKKANTKNNTEIIIYPKLKINMNKPSKISKNCNISIVTMFRFEDDYLEEWLHYYIMHGVDHFSCTVIIIHSKLRIF